MLILIQVAGQGSYGIPAFQSFHVSQTGKREESLNSGNIRASVISRHLSGNYTVAPFVIVIAIEICKTALEDSDMLPKSKTELTGRHPYARDQT